MKLKDPFNKLEELRRRIGGIEHAFRFDQPLSPLLEIERKLEKTGVEVERADIQSVGPFLTYKGDILAILYIFDSTASSEELSLNKPGSTGTPKFHFTWCRTLEQMTSRRRFDRYVLSRSRENIFRVEAFKTEEGKISRDGERDIFEKIRLFPCQNCLDEMNYHGFLLKERKERRLQRVGDFSINDYLEENDGNLTVMKHLPNTLAENATGGGYTKDFSEISRKLREECSWKCTSCQVDMSSKKAGLHVHHINGVKSDNSHSNLKVLCAVCHRDVDEFHRNMYIKENIKQYIMQNQPQS